MKVSELIEILKTMPQEYEVIVDSQNDEGFFYTPDLSVDGDSVVIFEKA